MKLTEAAITRARQASEAGTPVPVAMCLSNVENAYQVPHLYPSAAAAWGQVKRKHPTSDPHAIPRGVPIFWTGGSHGYGHVAISAGGGACWSTDITRPGRWDRVPVDLIRVRWGLQLAGWSEDLSGVQLYAPTPAPSMPVDVPAAAVASSTSSTTRGGLVDSAEHDLDAARRKSSGVRRRRLGAVLGYLRRTMPGWRKRRRHAAA